MLKHRLLASSFFLTICFSASAADHLAGTWKLNPEKSGGGTPTISNFERDGDFIKNSNGTMSYRFKFDGQDNPVTGSTLYDMASWKQIDPRAFEHTMKKDSKVVYTVRTVCAADGKTRTWKNTRNLANGGTATSEGIQERTAGEVDPSNPLLGNWRQIPFMKIEGKGKGIRLMSGITYTANFDGKDYPVTGSNNTDTVSLKRLNAQTVEQTSKKGAKVVLKSNWVMSDGGKTLTITSKGTRSNGEPFNTVTVWERTKL
jgi:hypothetical protein